MKKTVLFLALTLSYFVGKPQTWKNYKINEDISVDLPEKLNVKTTASHKALGAETSHGLVAVTKVTSKISTTVSIRSEEDLITFYRGLQTGFAKGAKGSITEEKTINIGNLKAKQFTVQTTTASGNQLIYCTALAVNDTAYIFNFLETGDSKQQAEAERNKFFSSIKVSDQLTLDHQFTSQSAESRAYKQGRVVGQLVAYLLILSVLVYIIIKLIKRGKKLHS